jgi:hypothetical protein
MNILTSAHYLPPFYHVLGPPHPREPGRHMHGLTVAGKCDIATRQRRRAAINAGKPAPLLLWRYLLALCVRLVTGNTRVVPSSPTRCGRWRPSLSLCVWQVGSQDPLAAVQWSSGCTDPGTCSFFGRLYFQISRKWISRFVEILAKIITCSFWLQKWWNKFCCVS